MALSETISTDFFNCSDISSLKLTRSSKVNIWSPKETRMSTSLSGLASPLAYEPKTPAYLMPYFSKIGRVFIAIFSNVSVMHILYHITTFSTSLPRAFPQRSDLWNCPTLDVGQFNVYHV